MYRLVNGEGDRLSGLVIDVFAGVIGVSSSAVWVEAFRSEIEEALREEFGEESDQIVWRRSDGRLQQDGWTGQGVTATTLEVFSTRQDVDNGFDVSNEELDGLAIVDKLNEKVIEEAAVVATEGEREEGGSLWDMLPATIVRELGLEYEVHAQFGQKTGMP